ncbi:MAG TPA: Gfo/Idh/MocA family oxidoreductase [Solirubrobacteraceae bacterium]|jgi:predicted dehydrogenase
MTAARLRVAVVGAGAWGEQHARIFARRPDTELVGIVARTPERARARAQAYETTAYTSIAEMLEQARPDLVTTSLPNEAHFEPTLELIRHGVPLLAEKPLVFSLAEADRLIEEAARRDLFFAINFNHRYAEAVQRAHAAIAGGELGEVVHVTWRFGGEANPGTSPHRNLIETQCHGFDMLEHLAGPISSVMAQMTNTTDETVYNTVVIAVAFAGGGVGSLVGTYDSSYAYPDTQYIEVNGTRGRALVKDTVQELVLSTAGEETHRVWRPGYFNDLGRTFTHTFDRHVEDVLTALRAGSEPPIHARAGRRAVELAEASVRSFEDGIRVQV